MSVPRSTIPCWISKTKPADPEPPAPRVITSSNWEWAAVVVPLVRGLVLQNGLQLHQITLLARSVRADTNRPLAILINALAHAGCPVYVHGVDGPNDRVQRGKLRVCTWHASKGTQNTAVIVLGVDGDSQHNPLHVALTRSRRHVFVLHDRRKQHIGMVRAAKTLECVDADTHTLRSTADQQIDLHAPGSVALAPRVLRNLEAWSPRGRCTRVHNLLRGAAPAPPPALAGAEALVDEVLVQVHGLWEDVTAVYMLAALLCAEQCDENQCKRVRDMVAPTRASRDTLRVELERGNDVRFLDVRVRDEEALPTSARRELRAKAAPDCDGAAGAAEAEAAAAGALPAAEPERMRPATDCAAPPRAGQATRDAPARLEGEAPEEVGTGAARTRGLRSCGRVPLRMRQPPTAAAAAAAAAAGGAVQTPTTGAARRRWA